MKEPSMEIRLRYPWHARLLVGASWCLFAVVLLILSLFMLPIVPLAPVFVMIMVSLGGLLSSVHEYARGVATPVPAWHGKSAQIRNALEGRGTTLPRPIDAKVAQVQHGAPEAS